MELGITPAQAAVATDAVMTAYHAVLRRAEVKREETVFLFGLGGLGFNALQVIHSAIRARVIVSDIRQERLDAAAQLGVPKKDIVPVGKLVQEFVQENGLQGQIDTVLDFVGEKQTFEDAQHIGEFLPLCMYCRLLLAVNLLPSPNRRQGSLYWHSIRLQYHQHEDGNTQETSFHLLVWRAERRLSSFARAYVKGSDHASG